MACQFFGPQKGSYLAEIQISAENLASTRQQFEHINVRIRGIPKDGDLAFWSGEEPRALFPERVFPTSNKDGTQRYKIEMVHHEYSYVFVEADVKNR